MYQAEQARQQRSNSSGNSGGRKNFAKVLQKKSFVKNVGQTYNYGYDSITVGKKMEAWLDPSQMPHGQSANLNKAQDPMMEAIRNYWGIVGGNVVKGHLLNDNMGGTANNNNLYPITGGANKNHLNYVENALKGRVWNDQAGVYYTVTVDANPNISEPLADFDCTMREWNPKTNKLGARLLNPVSIPSDLEDVRSREDDSQPFLTYDGDEAESVKRPKKPSWAKNPKTRVSELNDTETELRDMDMSD